MASMDVVQRLKELEPKHAEIKYRIINFVYYIKSLLFTYLHTYFSFRINLYFKFTPISDVHNNFKPYGIWAM